MSLGPIEPGPSMTRPKLIIFIMKVKVLYPLSDAGWQSKLVAKCLVLKWMSSFFLSSVQVVVYVYVKGDNLHGRLFLQFCGKNICPCRSFEVVCQFFVFVLQPVHID